MDRVILMISKSHQVSFPIYLQTLFNLFVELVIVYFLIRKETYFIQSKPTNWLLEKQRKCSPHFLTGIKQKYHLNTPEDWNSIATTQINSNGGWGLLLKYSMYEIKCVACPEGKSLYNNPPQASGYWEKQENVLNFLSELKQKYNLYTLEDWNSITHKHIQANGGNRLFAKYSMYELKCMACPEGKSSFNYRPQRQSSGYWKNEENILTLVSKISKKYNLNTPDDWKRISRHQIISEGGWSYLIIKIIIIYKSKLNLKLQRIRNQNNKTYKWSYSYEKRSTQRWLFLQIQKLFPREEIIEDYFHSEISRESGFNIQFDIFMMERKLPIEYHGKHHYEDIPQGFSSVEIYKCRNVEKENL